MKVIGVLLMAYGSPDRKEDIEAYYTHIRRGRKPTPERLAELEARYERIGGSPLNQITAEVARALESNLNQDAPQGLSYRAYVGMKHWFPYIGEAVDQMALDGIRAGVAMTLAPQYSRMSVGEYQKAAQERAAGHGIALTCVDHWHREPGYLTLMTDRVKEALRRFEGPEDVHVLFTAHSLPERILQWDDPYPKQLLETAEAIAKDAGVGRWRFAFQSSSQTGEPWLGPDILDVLSELADDGVKSVLVCPVGFVSDHLEVLYDIDVEAKERAKTLGLHLERTDSPNADPAFISALKAVIRSHEGSWSPTGGGRS